MDRFVTEMVQQLNNIRQNPTSILTDVMMSTASTTDKNETISYLRSVSPCTNTIISVSQLNSAEQQYVQEQGLRGTTGHGDFLSRISTIGRYRSIAENLAYGQDMRYTTGQVPPMGSFLVQGLDRGTYTTFMVSPRDVIVAWIIDAGVPSKSHRHNIFSCNFNNVGVGVGPHNGYRTEVGLMLAQDYVPL